MKKALPNFSFEKYFWSTGRKFVGGLDEVGRGCFAGPIVTACCGFHSDAVIPQEIRVDDSKILTHNERNKAYIWLIRNALFWGVGSATVTQINRMGINKATNIAFRKSVVNANNKLVTKHKSTSIDFLLIDAFYVPRVKGLRRKNQLAIVNGDELSISISAASILAKVHRDRLMESLGKKYEYENYAWEKNKGYGTAVHREAIIKYGITKHHRRQFVETFLQKPKAQMTNAK